MRDRSREEGTGAGQGEGSVVRRRSCGGEMREESEQSPLCSERCRMADLNKWFSGEYRISRPVGPGEDEEAGSTV